MKPHKPRKGVPSKADKDTNRKIEQDRLKVAELARGIKKNEDGSYTTSTYATFKKLNKPWPKVEKSDALVNKWKPLLTGMNPVHVREAARVLEMEAIALRELSETERSEAVGPMLKFVFPAINRYFNRLDS